MTPRICIAGGPGTGKTLLANRLGGEHGVTLHRTDELIGQYEWSELSAEVARWFDTLEGPWVIEGVRVPHALRKWFRAHPEGLPADYFLWLTVVHKPLTPKQAAMGKSVKAVWRDVEPILRQRGAKLFTDTQGGPL